MPTSLRTSLDGLFDDAGLFPPARHPMSEALAIHARMRSGPHAHLVGPFLTPLARLSELDACVAGGSPRPEELSLVLYSEDDHAHRAVAREGVVQVEAPLGVEVPSDAVRLRRFVELPPAGDVAGPIEQIVSLRAMVKVRCGGATPDTVPSVERLAEVIHLCAAQKVPFKATAGLHRPFRQRDEATGVVEHGFLNLLAAASAAMNEASLDELSDILTASGEDGESPVLTRIDRRARELLLSIGTCSLDEPKDALVSLGLLERQE